MVHFLISLGIFNHAIQNYNKKQGNDRYENIIGKGPKIMLVINILSFSYTVTNIILSAYALYRHLE